VDKQEFLILVDRYLDGKASEGEEQLLINYYQSFQDHDAWDETLMGEKQIVEAAILQKWKSAIGEKQVPVRRIFNWRKWAVAASLVLAIGVGSYLLFFNKTNQKNFVKTTNSATHDVGAPTTAKATLKLNDGTIISLDSANNGSLAMQGNVNVVKLADSKISYQLPISGSHLEVAYNELTNPRGSKVIDMILGDGSHIWLNAGSSVTFPVAFIGNERKVSITGEAYFEVAHSISQDGVKRSFLVESNGVTTEVLGTHFNVNAYADEDAIRVTLLEGSVEVKTQMSKVKITPGQQAVSTHDSRLTTHDNVDIEQVMAWKNGYFSFRNTDLQTLMRDLARWYDLDVEFQPGVSHQHFSGDIGRGLSLSQVLEGLQLTGVHYKIDERKIVILAE
jgi:ferric-dicitrate binding protein FerR (iron transport regulator)